MKNKQIILIKQKRINLKSPSLSTGNLINKNNDDLYNELMKTNMKNYNVNKESTFEDYETTKNILNISGLKIDKDEKNLIKRINNYNKKYKREQYKNPFFKKNRNNMDYSNETVLSVSIPKENYYMNPLHSLGALKINYKIHSNIINENLKRQKNIFNKFIKENEQYKINHLLKMPKIKISTIAPVPANNISLINKNKNKKKLEIKSYISGSSITKLYSFYKFSTRNFPESREQFSLVVSDNILYLIGGICCTYDPEELWICDLATMMWTKIKKNTNPFIRYGHISVLDRLESKIFIYGGRTKYDKFSNLIIGDNTNAFCGMEYYDIKLNKWFRPLIGDETGYPPLRRNHIGEILGNQLIIHGGIDEYGDILNDVFFININNIESNKERWTSLMISSIIPGPYVYGHSSALVLENEIIKSNKTNVYYFPDDEKVYIKNIPKNRIKLKGLYIFGGKKKIEGTSGISNDLYVLVLGKKPCHWKKLDNVRGKKPPGRYCHSMNFYEPGNFLIIHGGRNDSQSESFALDDTYIFDLDLFQWNKIDLISNTLDFKVMPRCAHDSVIYSDKLIIFGGMNNHSYLGASLFVISLNDEFFINNSNISNKSVKKNNDNNDNEISKSMAMNISLPIIK